MSRVVSRVVSQVVSRVVSRVVSFLRKYALPLVIGVFIAMIWMNIDEHSYHVVWGAQSPDHHWQRDHCGPLFFRDLDIWRFFVEIYSDLYCNDSRDLWRFFVAICS